MVKFGALGPVGVIVSMKLPALPVVPPVDGADGNGGWLNCAQAVAHPRTRMIRNTKAKLWRPLANGCPNRPAPARPTQAMENRSPAPNQGLVAPVGPPTGPNLKVDGELGAVELRVIPRLTATNVVVALGLTVAVVPLLAFVTIPDEPAFVKAQTACVSPELKLLQVKVKLLPVVEPRRAT